MFDEIMDRLATPSGVIASALTVTGLWELGSFFVASLGTALGLTALAASVVVGISAIVLTGLLVASGIQKVLNINASKLTRMNEASVIIRNMKKVKLSMKNKGKVKQKKDFNNALEYVRYLNDIMKEYKDSNFEFKNQTSCNGFLSTINGLKRRDLKGVFKISRNTAIDNELNFNNNNTSKEYILNEMFVDKDAFKNINDLVGNNNDVDFNESKIKLLENMSFEDIRKNNFLDKFKEIEKNENNKRRGKKQTNHNKRNKDHSVNR